MQIVKFIIQHAQVLYLQAAVYGACHHDRVNIQTATMYKLMSSLTKYTWTQHE